MRQTAIRVRGDQTASITRIGVEVRGGRGAVGFRVRHFEARETATRPRLTRGDILAAPIEDVQFKGKTIDFREARFQLIAASDWLTLDIGKDAFSWGPSPLHNLFLDDASPSYYYVRFDVQYGALKFSHFFGALAARPGTVDTVRSGSSNGHLRTFTPPKRISAHRLELVLGPFVLGAQEAVVYGDRGFELAYLPPPSVLIAAQSFLGNTDNLAFSVDISTTSVYNTVIYGSMFFDDLKKFSPGAFANKLGLQAGIHAFDMAGIDGLDGLLEYVRVDPYVYTHNFDINAFEHFDSPLGHTIGPNADRLTTRISYRPTSWLKMGVHFARTRSGENPIAPDGSVTNVGGDLQLGRRPGDPESKSFLDGDNVRENAWTVDVRADLFPGLWLGASYRDGRTALRTDRRFTVEVALNAF